MIQKIGIIVFRLFRCDYYELHPCKNNANAYCAALLKRTIITITAVIGSEKEEKTTEKIAFMKERQIKNKSIKLLLKKKKIIKRRRWPSLCAGLIAQLPSNMCVLANRYANKQNCEQQKREREKTHSRPLHSMFPHRLPSGRRKCDHKNRKK